MDKTITFIDLCAGIGGIRLAFERAGATSVFSSAWDTMACRTYEANVGERSAGDITQIPADDIPNHDILTAGFPRQTFSIAGVTKHNALGNAHGFAHTTQDTLFFDIARIIERKRPRAFLLEVNNKARGMIAEIESELFKPLQPDLLTEDWLQRHGDLTNSVRDLVSAFAKQLAAFLP